MINGFTELGNVLDSAMKGRAKANDTVSNELGTINSDMSLSTDSFDKPIPKGDYMVDVRLTHNHGMEVQGSGSHGGHEGGNGSHSHTVAVRTLKAGDRVLVAIVGTERIVTNIITSSNNI